MASRLRLGSTQMGHAHLTHRDLGFWVDVSVHERDGRFMVTADLGEDSRDVWGGWRHASGGDQGFAEGAGRAVCE